MPHILTLVAARDATTLSPGTVALIRDVISGQAPVVLSPGEAVDIRCADPPDMIAVRAVLGDAPVDALANRLRGRRKGLLVADMDSTIVTSETLDEIAAYAGLKDRIAAITRASMNGEIDFREALRARVAMLKGLDLSALEATWNATAVTPGARELVATMRAHNALTALVSGGFTYFTSRVAALCGFDVHRANTLIDDGAALTGEVGDPILDRDAKLAALQEFAAARGVKLAATLAVAGMGVAFHAKPIVAAEARFRVDHCDLRALLFAQGYPAAAFVSE